VFFGDYFAIPQFAFAAAVCRDFSAALIRAFSALFGGNFSRRGGLA
jgi:hypothetical protein